MSATWLSVVANPARALAPRSTNNGNATEKVIAMICQLKRRPLTMLQLSQLTNMHYHTVNRWINYLDDAALIEQAGTDQDYEGSGNPPKLWKWKE